MNRFWRLQREHKKKAYNWQDWDLNARVDQRPPADENWLIWLLMGGRGCGKTRAGAEWIRAQAKEFGRIALIAPTFNDAREVMLEGESGLLRIGPPAERPVFTASRRLLEWPNGTVGYLFSAEDPDSLRGPQFGAAWADEFGAWTYPEETLSNLRLGLRLGERPRLAITTTPRPTPAILKLVKSKGVVITRAKTRDNAFHLSESFVAAMEDTFGRTRLGQQELDGVLLADQEGALWSHKMIETAQWQAAAPDLGKTIISVDPPVTAKARSDQCGIIVAGLQGSRNQREPSGKRVFILQDATVQGVSPQAWAQKAIDLYYHWQADYILVEVNQGGDLVTTVISALDPSVPVKTVFAKTGKQARAEPVAMLYEQGRVFHMRSFKELEAELTTLGTSAMKKSPDRADALVWAVSHLLLEDKSIPKIRHI